MEINKIKYGDKLFYVGKTNKCTYEFDITHNSACIVKKIICNTNCQVEFENGILTSIAIEDLEEYPKN